MLITEDLIRRIERSEAERVRDSAVAFGGKTLEIEGGVAAECGEGNVMTQTVAIGNGGQVSAGDFETILGLYRGSVSRFEFKLSPIADMDLRSKVVQRSDEIPEFETLLVLDLSDLVPAGHGADIRDVPADDIPAYSMRSAKRFYGENPPPGLVEVITASCRSKTVRAYELFEDGIPVAGCALGLASEVAWLSGAAVEPQHRGHGLHRALQAHRLKVAREMGYRLVCQGALPGSTSQQNAQKSGFEIAFTRPTLMVRP